MKRNEKMQSNTWNSVNRDVKAKKEKSLPRKMKIRNFLGNSVEFFCRILFRPIFSFFFVSLSNRG